MLYTFPGFPCIILTRIIVYLFYADVSLMERLMNDCDLYARKERGDGQHYDDKYITKLCRNFRSHERILYLPNFHFYHEDLIVSIIYNNIELQLYFLL